MSDILLELSNSYNSPVSDFIFYQYYGIIKYYTASRLHDIIKLNNTLEGNRDKNMWMDISLDVNVPDNNSYYNIINSDGNVLLSSRKYDGVVFNIYKTDCINKPLIIDKASSTVYNIFLDFPLIINTFYDEMIPQLYDNVPHALHVVPIFDKVFPLVHNYIRNLIHDAI